MVIAVESSSCINLETLMYSISCSVVSEKFITLKMDGGWLTTRNKSKVSFVNLKHISIPIYRLQRVFLPQNLPCTPKIEGTSV